MNKEDFTVEPLRHGWKQIIWDRSWVDEYTIFTLLEKQSHNASMQNIKQSVDGNLSDAPDSAQITNRKSRANPFGGISLSYNPIKNNISTRHTRPYQHHWQNPSRRSVEELPRSNEMRNDFGSARMSMDNVEMSRNGIDKFKEI